jgi:hypothetical protein
MPDGKWKSVLAKRDPSAQAALKETNARMPGRRKLPVDRRAPLRYSMDVHNGDRLSRGQHITARPLLADTQSVKQRPAIPKNQ